MSSFDEATMNEGGHFSPSDFMRARRPELYSDSILIEERQPDRAQLEFYLNTLTQRKEEIRFEHFCRRLAEKELCPNLLPQTGPTGGGDSKVDSETYPVSETIAERWYIGDPKRASGERWAFAFSAKAKWRPKIRDDVRKVVETARDYSLVYFVTNQAVPDRDRASVEDELRNLWNLDVRILDRTWIIDRVIEHKRWDVVYQTLDIGLPPDRGREKTGPLDTKRLQELEELDQMIGDSNRYAGASWQLFEDCLQSALLARGLGMSRTEVDGRFDRAQRLAEKHQNNRELFQVYYQRAWTANWWFDDYAEVNRLYELAEPLVLTSEHIWDIDKLCNLWQIGVAWLRGGVQENVLGEWAARAQRLRSVFIRHSLDPARPTSALWSRTQLLIMDLVDAAGKPELLTKVLVNLKAVLLEADGHLDYPADTVVQIIEEMAELAQGNDAFDELFEVAVELRAKRAGRGKEGEMRLKQGLRKLKSGKPYAAIQQCATAQSLLAQNENKSDFVHALLATGLAYEAAGLLWASRANLVYALSSSMYEYLKEGKVDKSTFYILRKLVWVEMQLGRAPCVLSWLNWLKLISGTIGLSEEAVAEFGEEFTLMDRVFGILILRTKFSDWQVLAGLPAFLEHESLGVSSIAALFCLGDIETLRSEIGDEVDQMTNLAQKWVKQSAGADLPAVAEWHNEANVSMRTVLLGCEIEFVVENNTQIILLAEALLGFLEGFLATTIEFEGLGSSARQYLRAEIASGVGATNMPFLNEIIEDDCGETSLRITVPAVPALQIASHKEYQKTIAKFLGNFVAELHVLQMDKWLEKMFAIDRAQDRAYLLAQSIGATCNVLGESPKYRVSDLVDAKEGKLTKQLRSKPWDEGLAKSLTELSHGERKTLNLAEGPPPDNMLGVDGLKHRDLKVYSPINMPLWDRAKWRGAAFACYSDLPPELFLGFFDFESGIKIFRGWRKRVGPIDKDEWIGVTVITGTDRKAPASYRIAVSVGEEYISRNLSEKSRFSMVSRMQDMTPSTTANLDAFLAAFAHFGSYRFGVAEIKGTEFSLPPDREKLMIRKNVLRVVPAWKVGPTDPASMALGGITDPVVPPDATNVPFRQLEAMRRKR